MRYLMDEQEFPLWYKKYGDFNPCAYKCFYVCKACGSELYSEYNYPDPEIDSKIYRLERELPWDKTCRGQFAPLGLEEKILSKEKNSVN